MKERIYSNQKCPICGGVFRHDENRGGLFCKQHPQIAASSKFFVRFGRATTKTIGTGEVEDFLFGDHQDKRSKKPISDKTRHNMRSCLHQFFKWVCRREKSVEFPDFPEISFELGWRNTVTIEVQQSIIQEVKRISFDIEPKIWLGIKLLATYIKIRPGEMRNVRERDINLESGFIHIPHPKEGSRKQGKFAYLDAEDVDLIKSFPRSIDPDQHFFRHMATRSGIKVGVQFGPKYFKKWWDKACDNLGIKGVYACEFCNGINCK
jgi:hypothetical protein